MRFSVGFLVVDDAKWNVLNENESLQETYCGVLCHWGGLFLLTLTCAINRSILQGGDYSPAWLMVLSDST